MTQYRVRKLQCNRFWEPTPRGKSKRWFIEIVHPPNSYCYAASYLTWEEALSHVNSCIKTDYYFKHIRETTIA